MTKILPTIFIFILLSNCSTDNNSKDNLVHYPDINLKKPDTLSWQKNNRRGLYEYITKITFPKDYKLIATADSDFISIVIMDLNKNDCMKLYNENEFTSLSDPIPLTLIGISQYLNRVYYKLPDKKNLFRIRGIANRKKWTHLLDTAICRLYCQFDGFGLNREIAK